MGASTDFYDRKGFTPRALIGKQMPGGQGHWEKSDTFFSVRIYLPMG
jgi:hypothetical protein